MTPHPSKMETGGEDAHLHLAELRVFGVFDGVGGWAEVGVDPSVFSRNLAAQTRLACEKIDGGRRAGLSGKELRTALANGLRRVYDPGSATACLISVGPSGELACVNVGDSGFRVFRPQAGGKAAVVCRSQDSACGEELEPTQSYKSVAEPGQRAPFTHEPST